MRPTLQMEGALIGGRYLLEDLLGEGGMGGVFRARDQTLQRPVAVKLLFSGDERDREQRMSRFLREARIAAAVQHKNVVHIVDFGSTDEGRPYMVMEYLKGTTLADRLAQAPAPTVEEYVRIIADTLGGLAAAHDAGVVHRDMKPENVFLVKDADGAYPKILDFGISRSLVPESGPSSALTTREGFLVGTPQYMSPEQARGLKDVDRVTDIYSVGVILYEALTGRLPFNSEHMGDLIILIASGSAPTVSELRDELGEPLSEVVRKAMSVDREARYADARQMRTALTEALERMDAAARELRCRPRQRRSLAPPQPTAATTDGRARGGGNAPEEPTEQEPAARESAEYAKTLPAESSHEPKEVPPPNAVAANSIETPNAWSVDRPPPSKAAGKAVIAFAALALLGIGGFYAIRGADERPRDTVDAAARRAAPDPEPEPEPVLVPDPEPGPEVTFRFVGADGATITVDGDPVEGDSHVVPRDGRMHTIAAVAEGMQPFEIQRPADDDATIAIELVPIEPTATAAPTMRTAATMRTGMRPRMRTMRGTATTSTTPPDVLTMLDY